MECKDVREQLGSYIDNELTPDESASLASHLDHCHDCRQELEVLRAVTRTVSSLPRVNPPSYLHTSIMAGIQREALTNKTASLRPSRLGGWKRWTAVAAAVLLALMSYRIVELAPHIKAPGEAQQSKSAAPAYSGQTPINGDQHDRQANKITLNTTTSSGYADASIEAKGTSLKQDDAPPANQAASFTTTLTVMDQVPVVSTPNPSFSAPRDDTSGDRGMTTAKTLQTSALMSAPTNYKEYVTQIRLVTLNREEFKRRLYTFAQSEQIGVTEIATGNQTLGFTIRGSMLEMSKVETQLAGMASIVGKKSTVNDLQNDWSALQEQIAQLQLEYHRREDLLREARSSSETGQMAAELDRIRSEIDNRENSARLMQERFGTTVLELYLQ